MTAQIWQFLLAPDALDLCRHIIPTTVEPRFDVTSLFYDGMHPGLKGLLHSMADYGTMGRKSPARFVNPICAKSWHRFLPRLEYWIPRIQHWQVLHGDYYNAPDQPATWFIDPPYQNSAGTFYRAQPGSFDDLRVWCESRPGQVIICESAEATWVPAWPRLELSRARGFVGRHVGRNPLEICYYNPNNVGTTCASSSTGSQ